MEFDDEINVDKPDYRRFEWGIYVSYESLVRSMQINIEQLEKLVQKQLIFLYFVRDSRKIDGEENDYQIRKLDLDKLDELVKSQNRK